MNINGISLPTNGYSVILHKITKFHKTLCKIHIQNINMEKG